MPDEIVLRSKDADAIPGVPDELHAERALAFRQQCYELQTRLGHRKPISRYGFRGLDADAARIRTELRLTDHVPLSLFATNNLKSIMDKGERLLEVLQQMGALSTVGSAQLESESRAELDARFRRDATDYLLGIQKMALLGRISVLEDKLGGVEGLKGEADGLLKQLREALASTSVSTQAQFFREAAARHANTATTALYWVVGLSALTIMAVTLIAYFSLTYLPTLSTPQAIQLIAAKALIISVLVSGIVLATRTYRAHQHNEIVNMHRVNALSTFDAFVQAASGDPDTKNAVLLHASTCIFAAQPSGYAHGDSDGLPSPHILDIAKLLVGKRE